MVIYWILQNEALFLGLAHCEPTETCHQSMQSKQTIFVQICKRYFAAYNSLSKDCMES